MIQAHVFLDGTLVAMPIMSAAPRAGETVRFSDDVYGLVTEIVWCLDETGSIGQRVNIRVESSRARVCEYAVCCEHAVAGELCQDRHYEWRSQGGEV